MYCKNCGTKIEILDNFCVECGAEINTMHNNLSEDNLEIEKKLGFSKKINHPVFKYARKKKLRVTFIFYTGMGVLSGILINVFAITDGDEFYFPAFIAPTLIGVAFSIFKLIPQLMEKSWEGTVIDMKSKKEMKDSDPNDEYSRGDTYSYVNYLVIEKDKGIFNESIRCMNKVWNYYKVGDRVKKHKGFEYLEKYDKTNGEIICINCSKIHIEDEIQCSSCKYPLLT